MELPETSMLNFFNKVLISLAELTPDGDSCSVDSLITHCKSFALGGVRGEYESVLNHCKVGGLISIKGKNVSLSTLGNKFLTANREKYFEITESQKQIIAERIVFKGAWSNHARELFEHFSANTQTTLYELSTVETSLPQNQNVTVHFFKYLGILQEENSLILVHKRYSQLVYELTADSKAISEQQLEQLLMENRKLGAQAENAVVEFEKQRLLKMGKTIQSELVKRISIINTAAGYDIESFDGTTDDVFPNRFIEVKATTGEDIRFYWTINEREVAKKKKNQYWIYVLTSFREDRPSESLPITIQNPEHIIPKHDSFSIEVNKYLISEIAEIELTEQHIDELKWYQLD
ncbi:MAG: DUF3883 domain-containing protein [Bacteroidetes bacterium]|jgi:hypothetical protein|nr:DUF3883 domain-containing protein [Bacteroidota bacterium]